MGFVFTDRPLDDVITPTLHFFVLEEAAIDLLHSQRKMSSVPEPQNGLVVRNELLYFLEVWCGIPDEDGSLAHVISCSFSLAAIEDAHRCLETLCNLKIPQKPKPKNSLDWLIRREAAETLVRLRGTAGYIVGSHSFSVDPKLQVSLFRQLWERKKITGHIREHEEKLRALDERLDRRECQDKPIPVPIPPLVTLSSPQDRPQWTIGNSPPLSQNVLDLLVKPVPSGSVSSMSFPVLCFPPMPAPQPLFQPTFTISGSDQDSLSPPKKGRPFKNRSVPVQQPLIQTTFTINGPGQGSVSPPKKGRPLKIRPPKSGTLREIRPRGETHVVGVGGNKPITVPPQPLATGDVLAPGSSSCLPPGAFGSGYGVSVPGADRPAPVLLTAPKPGSGGEQFLVIAGDVSVPAVPPSRTAPTVRRDLPVSGSTKPLESVVTALRQLAALKASNSRPATRSRGKPNSEGLVDRLPVAVKTEKDEGVPAGVPAYTPEDSLLLEFSRIDEDDPVSGRLAIDEDSHSQENPGVASVPENYRDQSPEW